MNILGVALPRSSTRIFAVALLVEPVMVSPTTNLPSVPLPLSKTISLPSTSNTLDGVSNSKSRLSILTVTRNSPASRYS
jgi:hypothetical protein